MKAADEILPSPEAEPAKLRSRLQVLYDRLWTTAIVKIRGDAADVDPVLQSGHPDRRRGLTLIARPDRLARESAVAFARTLRRLEPEQYYYAGSQLHLTVLSLFTATSNFQAFLAKESRYVAAVNMALKNCAPIRIQHQGITASEGGVMVQGFFQTDALNALRNKLRRQLKIFELDEGVDRRYRLETAHMTLVRFQNPLMNAARFARALERARSREFGHTCIARLDLVENDWYMSRAALRVVKCYRLKAPW